jgi:hypothetical protein
LILACPSLGAGPATRPAMMVKTRAMLDEWRPRLEAEHLRHLIAPPFLIAGDASVAKLASYRDRSVLAATRALEATYFDHPPDQPILLLLFESEAPYKRLSRKWFNSENVPHFGYYRHADRVMVMDVSTGTGTLVHELTHALIEPDFPKVPGWFNEGLASLYEQSLIDGLTIRGTTNWRLPALQKAIRDNNLRPLEQLITDPNFYRGDLVGLNYAQARYLILYLQEKQLLRDYYHRFRDHAGEDPSGLATLTQLISPQPLEDFESEWKAWVLRLRNQQ